MFLGVIADDFTGATDVAGMLVRAGMRTMQTIGVPTGAADTAQIPAADAVVVALKSRTVPVAQAVADSLAALDWLRAAGAQRFYFKYCSTFDSTPAGNIGPVAEALMARLGTDFTIACPAFPENGRTIFRGHLFVGDVLLSDSGMRDHPLTPMRDSNLVRVLQAQCRQPVGLVRYDAVARGAPELLRRFDALRADGVRLAVVDAVSDDDLLTVGQACAELPLVTAGSGVALGLPPAYTARGWIRPDARAADLESVGGHAAVLSGSCSVATGGQVTHWIAQGRPARRIDPRALITGRASLDEALAWARTQLAEQPVLLYATASPDEVRAVQDELGAERAGACVEQAMAQLAHGLVQAGVRKLVVAGGETSGAVVQALDVGRLRIGPAIDPGVPWTQVEGRPLLLALKSGNFGTPDFFTKALAQVA